MVDIAKFDRQLLAQVFKNPQAIKAFESLQQVTTTNVTDIEIALQTAVAAGAAASAANTAAADANSAAVAANIAATTANNAAVAASFRAGDAQDIANNAFALAHTADSANAQMASDASDLESRPVLFVGTLAQQNDDYVSVGQFGANGKLPQSAATLTAAATDLPTVIALANSIRAALIACGIGQ